MKKLIFSVLCALVLIITSCGSDDGGGLDCITQTNNVANAVTNFDFTDFSVENCQSMKNTLQTYLDSGCAPDEATAASFRQNLDLLGDCSLQ